jgi:hypothetical protein
MIPVLHAYMVSNVASGIFNISGPSLFVLSKSWPHCPP